MADITLLYVGQKFEVYGLPTRLRHPALQIDPATGEEFMVVVSSTLVDYEWPESDRHVEIVSISVTGKVCFKIHCDDDTDADRLRSSLHDIPLERIALMRQMGYWRTNSIRWPLEES